MQRAAVLKQSEPETETAAEIREWARRIRVEVLRMIHHCPAGHPGGSLSVADIVATLYFGVLQVKPEDPDWPERDRVVLSKGHACAAVYAALGLKGYFPVGEFLKFRRIDGLLEGHPSIVIPGIDAPSGSLGMGLSQGLGMALGARCARKNFRVYVILGDGDMQEGATWEALMAGGHHRLDNLCAILDYNRLQAEGRVADTMDYEPVADKVRSFRWAVEEVDGHDCGRLLAALHRAQARKGTPSFIIAHTIKGKGVSFMEDLAQWHGTVALTAEELAKALAEVNGGGGG
jgi:transketolase